MAKTIIQLGGTIPSLDEITALLEADEHGAVDIFLGKVRNHNLNRQVTSMTYDMFEPHAEHVLNTLCDQARSQWGEDLNIHIAHAKGDVAINGLSIVIAVSSRHRDASFKACRFLIEEIKLHLPVWKQEHYADGTAEWLDGHPLKPADERP